MGPKQPEAMHGPYARNHELTAATQMTNTSCSTQSGRAKISVYFVPSRLCRKAHTGLRRHAMGPTPMESVAGKCKPCMQSREATPTSQGIQRTAVRVRQGAQWPSAGPGPWPPAGWPRVFSRTSLGAGRPQPLSSMHAVNCMHTASFSMSPYFGRHACIIPSTRLIRTCGWNLMACRDKA